MDVDQALAAVGGFRKWQLVLFCAIGLGICMPISWHSLAIVFVGWEPPHHCKLADGQVLSEAVPMEPDPYGEMRPSQCTVYVNGTTATNTTDRPTEICPNGWTFNSKYKTIVSEWDLVCGQNYLAELSQTIMQVGALTGELVTAILVDRIGRKKVFISTFAWIAVFGVGCSFSPNYVAFVAFQTLIALGSSACCMSGFLLLMEIFDSSRRTEVGIGVEAFWVIDYVIMPLIGYLALYWRHFELFVSLSCLIWLVFIWVLPESPLWLAANKRYDDAERELQRLARYSGVKVAGRLLPREGQGQELLERNGTNENGKPTEQLMSKAEQARLDKQDQVDQLRFTHLFTDRKLLRHTIVSMLLWFANMTVYYGLILLTPSLAGNRFINFLMSALIEIPAYIVSYFICKRYGRRIPTCIAHVMAGLCLLTTPFIPTHTASGVSLGPLSTTMALLGKFFICISFAIILLYTKELFPTNLRGASGGLSISVGRLGSMAAPFAVYSAKQIMWLPSLIMGAMSIAVGFLTLILPETRCCALPQTLQDIRDMYRRKPGHQEEEAVKA